ncbi:MAG: hypothetical protein P8076_11380 [Gammaproteobacteria bacterium]
MNAHLLVAVSGHGYGHVAQVAPVVNALAQMTPGLRLTVYSAAPEYILHNRFRVPFRQVRREPDVGAVMDSALAVNVERTAAAYAAFHRHWDASVQEEAARLRMLAPDLVLADVPYRVLAAAARAAIPALALCSLNWADIYRHYCGAVAGADAIHRQIVDAYDDAEQFLCPEPSMPMPGIRNRRPVAPIAWPAADGARRRLRERLGRYGDRHLVLVTLGGIETANPMSAWQEDPDICYLVPRAWEVQRPGFVAVENVDLQFSDVLAGCDAVVTKPGYNTMVEAACAGVPVLYVPRADWPEAPWLVRWLECHGRCRAIDEEVLDRGGIGPQLVSLLQQPASAPPIADGARQGAAILAEYLA